VAKHPARCPRCGNRLEVDTAVDERIICSKCQVLLSLPGKAKLSDKVDPLVGQRLGEFEVVEFLGRGGMGAVYKARQASLDRLVAIKVLPRAFSRDASFVERFGREARAAAAVSHPNIIEIHAVGHDRGYQYIAMEFVDGESLADILKREDRLAADRALAMMKQVASALAKAHGVGVLHRDIKPSNILLTSDGLAKVADFGLAKRPGTELTVTATGAPIGTPLYLPPETARGKAVDARSDLYSLGATFYHALAGRPPFQGDSAAEVIVKHTEAQAPPLSQLAPDAPPALCRTIHRLLRKNPPERYPSAQELLVALQRVEARVSVSQAEPTRTMPGAAHPSLAERREAKKQQRRRATLIAGGCALAAIVLLVVLVLVLGRQGGRPPGEKDVAQPPSAVREQRRAAVPHGEKAARPAKKAARPAIAKPGPKVPLWEAAWKQAEAKAKTLVGEQRFGEAMATYEKLAGRFEDPRLADRAQKAVFAIVAEAKKAYEEAEKRARQLLTGKKFREARDALRPVIERFGVPGRKEEAEELVRQINDAEKAARAAAAKAAKDAAEEAARKRREGERKKREEAERRYAKALKPIEAMIQAWDFRGAAEALAKLRLDTVGGASLPREELAARLATRRDEVARLAALKAKMIRRINTAKPRLQRRSLLIRGVNADLVKADEKGITAKLAKGRTEVHPWGSLSGRSVQLLIQRSIDRKSGDDCLAAGILALALKDPKSAERDFEKARSLGVKIDRYLDPLVAAAFARAKGLLGRKQFSEADATLRNIEKEYHKAAWFDSHKEGFEAAREQARAGIAEAEAEKLYAQAVRLFKKKQLFALKRVIQKLKSDYPKTRPVTDPDRQPSFAAMAKAVGKLGKFITVRKDGRGDFKSIQAAIDAAPPNSLIEIQDDGPYREALLLPKEKERLTLRGQKGCWPTITSSGQRTRVIHLVTVGGFELTLERLVLAHVAPGGKNANCVYAVEGARRLRLRSALVYIRGGRNAVSSRSQSDCEIDTCFIVENGELSGSTVVRNSIWLSTGEVQCRATLVEFVNSVVRGAAASQRVDLRRCTILGRLYLEHEGSAVVDSIVGYVQSARAGAQIDYCNVFEPSPFRDKAQAGKRCFSKDPQFRDPGNFDYRLKQTSPCRRKASDGGDIGCHYTPEMLELLKLAHELRKKGIIKF